MDVKLGLFILKMMNLELSAFHSPRRMSPRGDAPRAENEDFLHQATVPGPDASAEAVVKWAAAEFGGGLALSSSFGADSALMLHMVTRVVPDIPVVFVDTGYLFPETYRFAEELRERLSLNLKVTSALMTPARQEALYGKQWEQGELGVKRYLAMNKVEPMQRALKELNARAWIAGLRGSQTGHRSGLSKVGLQDGRVKIHPILDWSREQVDDYLKTHDLPRHPLYAEGYRSLGDFHSTIPVNPGDDERSGRFLGAKSECGLHLSAEENSSFGASGL
jgi:phosphoadenosine phosphosulfate reductase